VLSLARFFFKHFGRFFGSAAHCFLRRTRMRELPAGASPMSEPSLPEESIFAQAVEIASAERLRIFPIFRGVIPQWISHWK
jgi:hypothetical protein